MFELGSLKRVLRHLEAIEPTKENVHHINAIRGMALACQFPLQDFLSRIAKYESSMSHRRGTSWYLPKISMSFVLRSRRPAT